jgi:hypothetical protein
MILRVPTSWMIMNTDYVTAVIQGKPRVTMGILMDEQRGRDRRIEHALAFSGRGDTATTRVNY